MFFVLSGLNNMVSRDYSEDDSDIMRLRYDINTGVRRPGSRSSANNLIPVKERVKNSNDF